MTRGGIPPHLGRRVALWLASLLASVAVLVLLFTGGHKIASGFAIMIGSALPAWILYLPLVFAFPNAEGWRGWILFGSGALIGPVTLCGWVALLMLHGAHGRAVWFGDPLAPNTAALLIFAAFVGGVTAGFYVLGLKLMSRRQALSQAD